MVVKSIFFCIVLWFLSLNFFQENPCDVVSQYPQWAAFFLRGAVVLLFVAVMTALKKDFIKKVSYAVVITGVTEAVLSLLQLYGFAEPRHGIFRQTGTFYNPGPLGCYLAFALTLALKEFLSAENKNYKIRFRHRAFCNADRPAVNNEPHRLDCCFCCLRLRFLEYDNRKRESKKAPDIDLCN